MGLWVWRPMGLKTSEDADCDTSQRPSVNSVVESGPILSWCQSLVLVRFSRRSNMGFQRDSVMAPAHSRVSDLERGRLVTSSPGCALFSNDEGAAPFSPGISLYYAARLGNFHMR